MVDDFLATFMGNQARARVVRVFALNYEPFTAGQIVKRTNLKLPAVQKEIAYLEKLGLIKKGAFMIQLKNEGERVVTGKQASESWSYDREAPYAAAVARFLHEVSPSRHDVVLEKLRRSGKIATVILSGVFTGDDTRPADVLLAGEDLNEGRVEAAIRSLEPLYGKELRYAIFTSPEFKYRMAVQDRLFREILEFPHVVLLDKTQLLRVGPSF